MKDPDLSFRAGKLRRTSAPTEARGEPGVSVGALAQTVRLALEGEAVAKFRDGDRDFDIRLQLAPEDRRSTDVLGELAIPAQGRRLGGRRAAWALHGARLVRLSDVATVATTTGPAAIERMNRQQIILNANVAGRSLGDVVRRSSPSWQGYSCPPASASSSAAKPSE